MTPPDPIPFLDVRGSYREVGRQIGEACRDEILSGLDFSPPFPRGRTFAQQLETADSYRAVTAEALPWVVEEIDGVAEAVGADRRAVFAASIEEIWYEPRHPGRTEGRCSDLVAVPPATADGHVLVAHNNDLAPEDEAGVVAIRREVPGDPVLFTVGIGPWISVGWNSAGLSLTGNELSPNDERVGIPRLLHVREMLRHRTLEEVVESALRPDRASSYNDVLAHRDGGRVVNVEGSATDAELTRPGDDGYLAHTNNYVCERMLRYEGDPDYAQRSGVRYRRGLDLLTARPAGSVTEALLREMLSDHENAPDSICRHPEPGGDAKTVFWCVADVTEGRITYGRGNPCESQAQAFSFT